MPFDGIFTKAITHELNSILSGGRIDKAHQPENDEIMLLIRSQGSNHKLLLSANPSFPRLHITNSSKKNPITAPLFCMLLRKHIVGSRIIEIKFHDFERIATILVESLNDFGELVNKKLVIEIMGKHSNIILLNENDKIIDSIKHIDLEISRKREIMPARQYEFPPSQNKLSISKETIENISDKINNDNTTISKFLLTYFKGFSPTLISHILYTSNIPEKLFSNDLNSDNISKLKSALEKLLDIIENNKFSPYIFYLDNMPKEFYCIDLNQYGNKQQFDSISKSIDLFFTEKDHIDRLKQKKSYLVKLINNNIDRCKKKIHIHSEIIRENSKSEIFKIKGELILANLYNIDDNLEKINLLNYYTENEYLEISLDNTITLQANAQKYFKKYQKSKISYSSSIKQLEETKSEMSYIESVQALLDNSTTDQDIDDIKNELINEGYINSKLTHNKRIPPSLPLKFESSDGFTIYVGKNNKQNDQLTLKSSSSNDLWFHTKNIPGSHVVVKKTANTISDVAIEEAAMLAAYHSRAKNSSNVPVDYTIIKNVKKPNGAKPGMVIYEHYKTIVVTPVEENIKKIKLLKM